MMIQNNEPAALCVADTLHPFNCILLFKVINHNYGDRRFNQLHSQHLLVVVHLTPDHQLSSCMHSTRPKIPSASATPSSESYQASTAAEVWGVMNCAHEAELS